LKKGHGGCGGPGDEEAGKTGMLMKRWGILRGEQDNLLKDLKESAVSCEKLGKKYGVSRQAIYAFSKSQEIKRPLKPRGHQTKECRLCQKLIQISKKPHSEFISFQTIRKETGTSRGKYYYHLQTLRNGGLVNEKFGRLRSIRAEKAYVIYTLRIDSRTAQ